MADEKQPRDVVDSIILILTLVVAFSIVAAGATIAIVEIREPETDTSASGAVLTHILTSILGALLGLIAGKSSNRQ